MTRLPTGNDSWLVLIPEPCLGSVLESCRGPEPKLCRDCEQFNNQDNSRTVLKPVFWCSGLLVEMTVLSHLSSMSPFVLGRCHLGSAWIHTKHLLIMLACAHHTWRSIKTNPAAPQLQRVDTWDKKKKDYGFVANKPSLERLCSQYKRNTIYLWKWGGVAIHLSCFWDVWFLLHKLWYS